MFLEPHNHAEVLENEHAKVLDGVASAAGNATLKGESSHSAPDTAPEDAVSSDITAKRKKQSKSKMPRVRLGLEERKFDRRRNCYWSTNSGWY